MWPSVHLHAAATHCPLASIPGSGMCLLSRMDFTAVQSRGEQAPQARSLRRKSGLRFSPNLRYLERLYQEEILNSTICYNDNSHNKSNNDYCQQKSLAKFLGSAEQVTESGEASGQPGRSQFWSRTLTRVLQPRNASLKLRGVCCIADSGERDLGVGWNAVPAANLARYRPPSANPRASRSCRGSSSTVWPCRLPHCSVELTHAIAVLYWSGHSMVRATPHR